MIAIADMSSMQRKIKGYGGLKVTESNSLKKCINDKMNK